MYLKGHIKLEKYVMKFTTYTHTHTHTHTHIVLVLVLGNE